MRILSDEQIKDRYGVADNPADKQRARDKSNVKLAKAKIAYKDADKTQCSSPDKKRFI